MTDLFNDFDPSSAEERLTRAQLLALATRIALRAIPMVAYSVRGTRAPPSSPVFDLALFRCAAAVWVGSPERGLASGAADSLNEAADRGRPRHNEAYDAGGIIFHAAKLVDGERSSFGQINLGPIQEAPYK